MRTVAERSELWQAISDWKTAGETIALVPTMGNLHAGHLALVQAARSMAARVVTSIFVNPTQFGANEDLDTYPRTPDADAEALIAVGCDLLFIPDVETMYPAGVERHFRLQAPEGMASILEGAHRPGHFDGVVTVVSRLFNLVQPDVAVFGEKDFQQLQIIRRMTEDLGYPIDIRSIETVRSETGLALSSRNRYLDPQQLEAAIVISRQLQFIADELRQGAADIELLEKRATEQLKAAGLEPDYVSIRRTADLQKPAVGDRELRILAAAWCGETRLIDNLNATWTCNHAD